MATTIAPADRRSTKALAELLLSARPGMVVSVSGADWDDFEHLLEVREEHGRRGVRIWYDRGELELMSTSEIHELWKKTLAALIECFAEETGRRCLGLGNMTIAQKSLERGFLPDECYYVQSVERILPFHPLDFTVDPPPDLAIEIEYSRSAIDKLGIYAAFRIPEVWRYDGETLTVHQLEINGEYRSVESSMAFPDLPWAELTAHLARAGTTDQITLVREFRTFLKEGRS